MGQLKLNPMQDGMGYFYGQYHANNGDVVRVDVLPPKSAPRPPFVIQPPPEQHATKWIVYANGVEIARLDRRSDLETLDVDRLLLSC